MPPHVNRSENALLSLYVNILLEIWSQTLFTHSTLICVCTQSGYECIFYPVKRLNLIFHPLLFSKEQHKQPRERLSSYHVLFNSINSLLTCLFANFVSADLLHNTVSLSQAWLMCFVCIIHISLHFIKVCICFVVQFKLMYGICSLSFSFLLVFGIRVAFAASQKNAGNRHTGILELMKHLPPGWHCCIAPVKDIGQERFRHS